MRTMSASFVKSHKDEANKKAGDNSLLSPAFFLWSFFYPQTTQQKTCPSQSPLARKHF